jgi:hypothetical protein
MGANADHVNESRADATAHRLTSRIDDLARALARAGASPEDSSRLLELAAIAAMHAVSLAEVSAVRPGRPHPVERAEPASPPVRAVAA